MSIDETNGPSNDETPPTEEQPTAPAEPARRLYRSREDRVIGGVCGGLAAYFGIDPVIVRIAAVVAAFFGGAGILAYIAALLLVPDEDGTAAVGTTSLRGRALTVVGIVLLVAAAAALVPWGWHWFFGGWLVVAALLAVLAYGAWSLGRGERPPREGESHGASVARALLLGLALLVGCGILAVSAGWAAAVGGDEVVAGAVIAAGALLAVAAFVRPVRWLIAPALAIALPAAIVGAAGIDVDNSIGERTYRPVSAVDIRPHYELGMGSLVVDLRNVDLPAGDQRIEMKVGVGEAVLLVPRDVCVASRAQVGVGDVVVFDQDNGGVDIDWDDPRRAPAGTSRVVLDADVGIGEVAVGYQRGDFHRFGPGFDRFGNFYGDVGNDACANA